MADPFNGTWKISLTESFVWDHAQKRHVADEVGEEIITLRIKDGVQDYEVLYGDDPQLRMGYTARYDSPDWVDYTVREIITSDADPAAALARFKERVKATGGEGERQMELGKAYGLIRVVYIDERTHYRITANPIAGKNATILIRRLAEDGNSYLTHMLDVNGVIFRIRKFLRV